MNSVTTGNTENAPAIRHSGQPAARRSASSNISHMAKQAYTAASGAANSQASSSACSAVTKKPNKIATKVTASGQSIHGLLGKVTKAHGASSPSNA